MLFNRDHPKEKLKEQPIFPSVFHFADLLFELTKTALKEVSVCLVEAIQKFRNDVSMDYTGEEEAKVREANNNCVNSLKDEWKSAWAVVFDIRNKVIDLLVGRFDLIKNPGVEVASEQFSEMRKALVDGVISKFGFIIEALGKIKEPVQKILEKIGMQAAK
jgi:hypothetical protein